MRWIALLCLPFIGCVPFVNNWDPTITHIVSCDPPGPDAWYAEGIEQARYQRARLSELYDGCIIIDTATGEESRAGQEDRRAQRFFGAEEIEPPAEWSDLWEHVRECVSLQGEPVRDRAFEDYTWLMADSLRVGAKRAYGFHDDKNWRIYLDRNWHEVMGTVPHEMAHAHLADRKTYHPETIFRASFFFSSGMLGCLER